MRILVAPDKFKGSLGAVEAAAAIAAGLRDVLPAAEVTLLPIADGGEGTVEVICSAAVGRWCTCEVHDPLGRIVPARYCSIAGGATAVMEMSEASGLWRVSRGALDPNLASSFGTGEMLLHAARGGAKKIIVGLGGSATNDGGFGMARALDYRFLDTSGRELAGAVSDLLQLARIEVPRERLDCEVIAAADVRNPLLGERGATRTFGPQKGATPPQIEILEQALTRFADVIACDLGFDFRDTPGAGAAGGLGFGLISFCAARMRRGFDVVAESIGLEAEVLAADVVMTGEGRLDAQTLEGKAPAGVARMARRLGKKVFAIVGDFDGATDIGSLFDGILAIKSPGLSLEEAMRDTALLLREKARELARLLERRS